MTEIEIMRKQMDIYKHLMTSSKTILLNEGNVCDVYLHLCGKKEEVSEEMINQVKERFQQLLNYKGI